MRKPTRSCTTGSRSSTDGKPKGDATRTAHTSTDWTLGRALAAGAVDAGCRIALGYPGSPATGVLEQFRELGSPEVHAEWSVNERTAFEMACGASIAGRRSLVCLKSVGLNAAMDPLMVANLIGVEAGLVIALGDDPGAHLSQNEQDSRQLVIAAELPLLEPSAPQQAYDMMLWAYDLSEHYGEPVFVRVTRWSVSQVGDVCRGESADEGTCAASRDLTAERRERRWISTTARAVELHRRLHERVEHIRQCFEASDFNEVTGGDEGDLGVLAVGCLAGKVRAVLRDDSVPMLSLGTILPAPTGKLRRFAVRLKRILVLEDGEPVVERELAGAPWRSDAEVCGKLTGDLPREDELTLGVVAEALRSFGVSAEAPTETTGRPASVPDGFVPPAKGLGLCRDCPYESLVDALRQLGDELPRQPVVVADPGCGVRLSGPPHHLVDVKYSMSSAIGIAAGIALADPSQTVIALPGDSAFFHSGITDLIDASWHRRNVVVAILDNGTTALTGYQTHPGSQAADGSRRIPPEALARAVGAPFVEVVDPSEEGALLDVLRRAMGSGDLSVVVIRKLCPYAGDQNACE